MMTRGRGGVTIPPKIDDVIYEQPLKMEDFAESLEFEIFVVDKDVWWEVVEVGASLRRNF